MSDLRKIEDKSSPNSPDYWIERDFREWHGDAGKANSPHFRWFWKHLAKGDGATWETIEIVILCPSFLRGKLRFQVKSVNGKLTFGAIY